MSAPGIEETWRADAAEKRVCELQHEGKIIGDWPEHSFGCEMYSPNVPALAQSGGEKTSTKKKTNE